MKTRGSIPANAARSRARDMVRDVEGAMGRGSMVREVLPRHRRY